MHFGEHKKKFHFYFLFMHRVYGHMARVEVQRIFPSIMGDFHTTSSFRPIEMMRALGFRAINGSLKWTVIK
jgi:hypothetical protein